MTLTNWFQIPKGWLKKRKFDISQNPRSPQRDGLQQEESFLSPSFTSFKVSFKIKLKAKTTPQWVKKCYDFISEDGRALLSQLTKQSS